MITKSYDYYADGALRFSSDSTNHKWDRFYSYDHVGRIKEAFSGAEARLEGQTTNRPYRQTFSYDGFNHITDQVSLNWSTNYSTSKTYSNNRNDSWSYDAQGNLLAGTDTSYSYDAAGRISTILTSAPDSTTARSLDGDGQQVKTEHVSFGEQGSVTTICYYLRSSVLQGQVLTEIGSTGAKKRTFIYAQEGTRNQNDPDVALGLQAINMGIHFSKTKDHRALAQGIWRDVCGGNGQLQLP